MSAARILVVCTANACRSPVAERLLARRLSAFGMSARVTSAGTDAHGTPVHRHTRAAARDHGLDLSDHQPRALTREILETDGRHLVIAMTRDHLYRIESLEPGSIKRAFTLCELAALAEAHGVDPTTSTVAEWAAALGESRSLKRVVAAGSDWDIADPYGRPLRFHEEMVAEVDPLIAEVVAFLAPSVDPGA